MANKRMFSLDIVDSDAFVSMPLSTQALYFHLSMRADDDGFVKNPKRIQRDIGSNEDDMKVLIAKRFILPFDSGIVVIKHWKINNNIRSDRYKPTTYIEERSMLVLKENGAYTEAENLGIPNDNQVGDTRYAQYSIGKGSIDSDKYSSSVVDGATTTPEENKLKQIGGKLGRNVVYLTDRQLSKEFTISSSSKSNLRKFIESWNSKSYSDDEFLDFDLFDQIGKPCQINVVLNETKEYSNVDNIMPIPRGFPAPTTDTKRIRWDMEQWDDAVFAELPEWIQDKIKKSTQYQKDHAPNTVVEVKSTNEGACPI